MDLVKVNELLDDMTKGLDGWGNVITGLGVTGRDRRMSAAISRSSLDDETLETLYQADDMAAKIVDLLPREMLRQGYTLEIEGDEDKELAKVALDRLAVLGVNKKIRECFELARLYGGAAILKGVTANGAPGTPSSIRSFTVLDKTILQPDTSSIINDLRDPNFGMPAIYTISSSNAKQNNKKVHRSRLVLIQGVNLPLRLLQQNHYWGQSVLLRVYTSLLNFNTGYDSTATILTDFTQAIFKIKNVNEILKRGKAGEEAIRTRLRLVTLVKSIINAIVIQDDEEYVKNTTNVAGLADLLKKLDNRLVAATDIPHTILLGESPSGLGATGNSEKTDWYDRVKAEQADQLEPVLRQIIDVILFQVNGGEVPKYTIQFNALWQMDDKEKAEVYKTTADGDVAYLDRGVLAADEVRKSRWGSGKYSTETQIDLETDLALNEIDPEEDPNVDE